MKKTIPVFLAALLVLSGCVPNRSNNPSGAGTSGGGTYDQNTSGTNSGSATAPAQQKQSISQIDTSQYNGVFATLQTISDPVSGAPIMDTVIPDGWTVTVDSNWNFVSTTNPCLSTIVFESPDKTASVVITTPQDYTEMYDTSGFVVHQDRVDKETYVTYLKYRNAGEFLDLYFKEGVLSSDGQVISESPVPDEITTYLSDIAAIYVDNYVNGINNTAGSYGITAQKIGSEGTACIRRYSFTSPDGVSYVADAFCSCISANLSMPSAFGSDYIYTVWQVPLTVLCCAVDETALESHRTECEAIVENFVVRDEFIYLKSSYGNYIQNMVMQNLTSQISAMTEAQANSFMNDYSDTGSSGDGVYTSDDWANDWSDMIYDQNEYTTTDGNTIKASTQYDSVYQNGDEFYFGSQGDAPYGWEQLTPN